MTNLDPALAHASDEELVVLAHHGGSVPARNVLLLRTEPLRLNLVIRLARRTGLDPNDRADAFQDSVFWTLEALQIYRPGRSTFRTFLHRVVVCRFADFLRRRRSYRVRFTFGLTVLTEAESRPALPEQDELRRGLEAALARLDPPSRRLWDLLAGGASVVEVAATLALSYDQAKRRRQRLIVRLRRTLRPHGWHEPRTHTGAGRCVSGAGAPARGTE